VDVQRLDGADRAPVDRQWAAHGGPAADEGVLAVSARTGRQGDGVHPVGRHTTVDGHRDLQAAVVVHHGGDSAATELREVHDIRVRFVLRHRKIQSVGETGQRISYRKSMHL